MNECLIRENGGLLGGEGLGVNGAVCQVFHSTDMVHPNILDLLAAQFADTPFDAGSISSGIAVLPPILRQGVSV